MPTRHPAAPAAPRRLPPLVAVAVLSALSACGASKPPLGDGGGGGLHTARPGMGDSTAAPAGTAYLLPAGITLAGDLEGRSERCDQREPRYGNGTTVWLCLGLTNPGASPVAVELPPGIIVVSRDVGDQNGILLQRTVILVPPGGTNWFQLDAYCLNHWRAVPLWDARYQLGPVTDEPDVLELVRLLESKQLPADGSLEVQMALWSITDGDGLTLTDLAAIGHLPERPAP